MKNPASMAQPDLRPYTRTFFRGNRLNFALALTDVLLSAAANLLISWLLQQIMDLIGGSGAGWTLRQLAVIAAGLVAGAAVSCLFSYFFKPRFLTRAMAQYRETLFGRLMEKPLGRFHRGKLFPVPFGVDQRPFCDRKGLSDESFLPGRIACCFSWVPLP